MAVVQVDRSRQPWSGTTVPCDQEDRDLFAAATTITLGDGNMARFRHAHWLEDKTRNKLAPAIFSASKRKNISVHNSSSMPICLTVDNDPVHGSSQRATGYHHLEFMANGVYSSNLAYRMQFMGAAWTIFNQSVRKCWEPPKCKVFSWLVIKNRVSTVDRL